MTTEEQIRKVNSMRKILRNNIDTFYKNEKDNLDSQDEATCFDCKSCLKSYKDKLEKLDNEYLDLIPNSDDTEAATYDAEVKLVMLYHDKVILSISALDNRIKEINNNNNQNTMTNNRTMTTTNSNGNNGHSKAKLKPLELPTYSGKETENFAEFLDTVEEMLDGRGLENIEKFIHLKSCLSGDPLHVVSALGNKNDSWDTARQKLLAIFSDSDEKKFKLLDSFSDLKFNYNDSILSFFSKIDHLLKEIDTVQIDIKYVAQYFVWNSIQTNKVLADLYMKVTDEAYPSLQMIKDKQNKVIRLYNQHQAKYKEFKMRKSQSMTNRNRFDNQTDKRPSLKTNPVFENSLAANIPTSRYNKDKQSQVWCSLCKGTSQDNNHPMFKCPQFITSKDKLTRIRSLKCCTKCGYLRHTSNDCTYVFKSKCKHCNSYSHFSWLCPINESAKSIIENDCESIKEESEGENEFESSEEDYDEQFGIDEDEIEEVKISMCSTRVNKSCLPSNAILPTFKGVVKGVNVRGLKDSGAQKNFISTSLVKKAGLKPGQQVELTVSGFNSAKTYRTYEVQVPLEFGGKTFDLDMIILPEVSTKFSADGISSVAAGFESKGYVLADPGLKYDRNIVGNMDIVLGINATHVFMEKVRTYGENGENYFLETIGGVMPIGHSLKAYAGLKYLPQADENTSISSQCKLKNCTIDKKNILPKNDNATPKLLSKNDEVKKLTNALKSGRSKSQSRSKSKVCYQSKIQTQVKKSSELPVLKKHNSKNKKSNKFKKVDKTYTLSDHDKTNTDNDNKSDNDDNQLDNDSDLLVSYQMGDIGKNFLRSLTPGYSKQQVFGDCSSWTSASEIDLDKLLSETLGYVN